MRGRSSGFTLVEILIVVGLLGVVTLGTITLITNMNRATKGVQFVGELNSFTDDVRGYLGDLSTCSLNFGATRAGGALDPNVRTNVAQLLKSDGTVAIDTAAGVTYGNGLLHVDSIEFGFPGTYAGPHPSVTPFQVRLRLRYSAVQDQLGIQNAKRDYNVWATTDAAGMVNVCSISALSPFASELIANNGYVMFPNGLLFQWGRLNANPDGFTTVTFPRAFPTQVFSVTLSGTQDTGTNSQDNWPAVYNHPGNTTRTTFQIFSANGSSDPVSWFAIGN